MGTTSHARSAIGQSRNAVPEAKKTAHYVTKASAEKQPSLRRLFSPRAELDQFSLLRLRDGSYRGEQKNHEDSENRQQRHCGPSLVEDRLIMAFRVWLFAN